VNFPSGRTTDNTDRFWHWRSLSAWSVPVRCIPGPRALRKRPRVPLRPDENDTRCCPTAVWNEQQGADREQTRSSGFHISARRGQPGPSRYPTVDATYLTPEAVLTTVVRILEPSLASLSDSAAIGQGRGIIEHGRTTSRTPGSHWGHFTIERT